MIQEEQWDNKDPMKEFHRIEIVWGLSLIQWPVAPCGDEGEACANERASKVPRSPVVVNDGPRGWSSYG